MNNSQLSVSVVICAYSMERFEDVREAADSVLKQTLPPRQVIVSIDHNRELGEKLKSRLPAPVALVFNDSVKGLSETRNTGVRIATGEIVAFIDDDAVAEKDWLEKLVRPFDNPAVAAAGGKIVPRWLDGNRPGWFPEELDWIIGCTYAGLSHQGNIVRNLIGCNMAFRSSVFDSVGLFNTTVGRTNKTSGIGEDSELCLRLTRVLPSALIVYEPEAVVYHKVPTWRVEPGYLLRRSFDEGYHKSKVKNLHSSTAVQALSTENRYLRHLLFTAVPRRLKRLYRPETFLQLDAIIACIAATGTGYLRGHLRRRTEHDMKERFV